MNLMPSMRVSLTGILLGIVSLSLIGCASLNQAGTASYSMKPVLINDKLVCCEVMINNGKQYASLDATLIKAGDDYTVMLSERGVEAFRGQGIAAGATKSLASTAAKASAAAVIAPLALPAAGAMLAAPGLGAAAAGAAAGVLINKAATP